MIELFEGGGVMMWPMLFIAIGVVVLAVRAAIVSLDTPADRVQLERHLQSIIFWGGMGAVLGLLGTVVGFVQIAQAIQAAGTTTTAIMWSGVGVALITLVFGLLILLVALLAWFGLRVRLRRVGGTAVA